MGNKGGKEKISPEARAKAEEVMKPFLQGYPGIIDDPSKCRNADFYLRDTYYKYNGQEFTLSAILRRLQNDPASLYHKDAVWWPTFVFPTRDPFPPNSDETVMHPLQIHEVRAITSNASSFLVFKQMVTAFLLSWGFYCDLLGPSPRIELHKDAYSRYAEKATHDPSTPRHITRVLKCMGELGLEYIKPQFVLALIIATYRGEKKWLSLRESLVLYWAPCLRSAKAREGAMNLIKWYEDHVDGKAPAPPMNVEWAKAEVDEDVAAQPWATGTSKAFFATHDFRLESQLNTAGEPQAAKSTAPTVNGVKGQTTSTTSSMESTSAPVPTLIEEDPQESGIIDESPSAVGTTSHPVQQARPRAATTSAVTLPPFVDKTRAPPALTGAYVAPLNDGAQKIFFDFPTTPVSRAPSTTLKGCTLAVLVGSFAPDLERLVVAAVHQLAAETSATVDTTSATIGSAIEAAAKVGNQTVLYFVPPDVVVNAIALRLRERIAAERKFLPPSTVSVCATSPAFLGAALRAPSRNAACILRDYVVVRDPLPSPLSRVVPLVAAAA